MKKAKHLRSKQAAVQFCICNTVAMKMYIIKSCVYVDNNSCLLHMTPHWLVTGYRLVVEHSQGSGSPRRDCSVFTLMMNTEGLFETSVTQCSRHCKHKIFFFLFSYSCLGLCTPSSSDTELQVDSNDVLILNANYTGWLACWFSYK